MLRVPPRLLAAVEADARGPLDHGPALERIVRGVEILNRGLTRDRERFLDGAYLADPALQAAYRAYYVCVNAPKLQPVLEAIAAAGLLLSRPTLRVLDLGGGPGTAAAAVALWAAERGRNVDVVATDALPENVRSAERLLRTLGVERVRTAVVDLRADVSPPGGPFDLVLLANVVNELPESEDPRLAAGLPALLAPGGLLVVVEPAARDPSRRALALRDRLVEGGWRVPLPCPAAGACPARTVGEWCHGAWRFERPAFVREVDRRVGTRREALKATWFVAAPAAAPSDADGAIRLRVVSERFDRKGLTRAVVCGPDGRWPLELLKRDRAPHNADFAACARHDLLRVEGPLEPLADGARRLTRATRCERAPG